MVTLVIYFYAHYAFASITAHVLAMFPPFVVMLIGLGTPALACSAWPASPTSRPVSPTTAPRPGPSSSPALRGLRRLVEGGLVRLGRQPRHLADGRLRVVEAPRAVVTRFPSLPAPRHSFMTPVTRAFSDPICAPGSCCGGKAWRVLAEASRECAARCAHGAPRVGPRRSDCHSIHETRLLVVDDDDFAGQVPRVSKSFSPYSYVSGGCLVSRRPALHLPCFVAVADVRARSLCRGGVSGAGSSPAGPLAAPRANAAKGQRTFTLLERSAMLRTFGRLLLMLAGILAGVSGPVHAATIFADGNFPVGNWTSTMLMGDGSIAGAQVPAGGNPDASLQSRSPELHLWALCGSLREDGSVQSRNQRRHRNCGLDPGRTGARQQQRHRSRVRGRRPAGGESLRRVFRWRAQQRRSSLGDDQRDRPDICTFHSCRCHR